MSARATRAIGVDVGTSSLKAVLIRHSRGRIRIERVASESYTESGRPTRSPGAWVRAASRALKDISQGSFDAVGFTGQMHALIPSAEGRLLAPAMLWLDMDGAPYLEAFLHEHARLSIVRRTGNVPLPDFTLAKWLALRADVPDIAARVDSLPAAKDFVREAFQAESSPVTDVNDASGTQWYDPFKYRWDRGITKAAGIPESALRQVTAPSAVVGTTGSRALPRGLPVVVGAGDQLAASRSLGALVEGRASLSLGTSGVLSAPWRPRRLPRDWDGSFHLFPLDLDGGYQVIATIPALAGALRWAARLLDTDIGGVATMAASASPRSAGLVRFFPYLGGSGAPHPDEAIRGQIRGLSQATDRSDVALAVLTGIASELACHVQEMRAAGVSIEEVSVSGGLASVDLLVRLFVRLAGVPVWRSSVTEGSAVGAALFALDGIGATSDVGAERVEVQAGRTRSQGLDDTWLAEREAILSATGAETYGPVTGR